MAGNRLPRLVATDLDGTFLSPDGTVSTENSLAVENAQRAGIVVVFATGRPVRWLDVIRGLPGAHPMVIASNGAVLYDLGTGRAVDQICIDPEIAVTAMERIRSVVPDAGFAFETGTRFGYEPCYSPWPADDGTKLTTAPSSRCWCRALRRLPTISSTASRVPSARR